MKLYRMTECAQHIKNRSRWTLLKRQSFTQQVRIKHVTVVGKWTHIKRPSYLASYNEYFTFRDRQTLIKRLSFKLQSYMLQLEVDEFTSNDCRFSKLQSMLQPEANKLTSNDHLIQDVSKMDTFTKVDWLIQHLIIRCWWNHTKHVL